MAFAEIGQIIHELQLYQIELELQNEELLRAQTELEAARERYFDLYDLAPVAYCTISEKGLILEANLTAAALLDVSRGALVNMPISRFIFREDQDIYYLLHKQLIETSQPQTCEIRFVKNEGMAFWAHLEITVALDEGGAPVSRVVLSDITHRKRAVKYGELGRVVLKILNEAGDLHNSIQRILTVLKTETGFDAVGIRLHEGDDFPYLAQKGFSPDFLRTENSLIERTLVGRMCRDKDGKVRLECTCGLVISGKTDLTNPLFTPGGSFWTNNSSQLLDIPSNEDPRLNPRNQCIHQGYASVALVPIRNKEKNVGLIQFNDRRKGCFTLEMVEFLEAIASHIGEALMRKQAEDALQESHRQNQEILDSITDAFISLTDDMVVTYFNSTAERLLNRKRIDVIGRSLFDVFPEAKGSIFEEKYAQAIRTKLTMFFEAELAVAPYQNWYDVRVYPSPEGITIYFLVITERKQAEVEKAKLESINRRLQKNESLGRMAGAIAHHFNNKLHAVMGNLELAIGSLSPSGTSITNLTAAMEAAEKAAEVSRMMLTYLGQVSDKRKPLDLSEVCRRSLPSLQATMPKNVSLETDLQFPGPAINANANQIQQVLTNLITNAWEAAGDDRGVIHLTVKTVSSAEISTSNRFPITWQPDDDRYGCLEVRDNACGIEDKDLEEVFSPFFSTKFTGRGMGLSVVQGLVQAHGGVVTAESSPGRGSVFRVFFPMSAEEIIQQPRNETNAPEIQETGMVLLVDDDSIFLEVTSAMLSRLGFTTVLTAMDGVEAVEVFRRHKDEIRLVVSDVSMPRMNGWETLLALRQIMPGIPVILSSGYSEEQVMEETHPENPQAFLGKPYGFQTLRDIIRRTLRDTKA
jgi:PAS domain S-box-containing protein